MDCLEYSQEPIINSKWKKWLHSKLKHAISQKIYA